MPATTTDNETTDADPKARDYFRVALGVFGRDPVLAAWKIAGDLTSALLRPVGILWVTTILAVGLGVGGYRGGGIGELMATLDRVDAPVAVGGLAGFAATLWLLGVTVESVISGGLYSAVVDELEQESDGGTGRLLRAIGRGFPKVFLLKLLGGAAELTILLLGLSVLVAVGLPFAGPGDTAAWGTLGQALFIAVPAFLFLSLAALVRLLFRVAAAPLFVDDLSVGDAVADGARFLLDRLAGVYRLFVYAASLMLVPLIGYWGWLLLANTVGLDSPFAPLFTAGRLAGYVLVYAGISLIGALFSAAVFAYYGATTGQYVVPASASDHDHESVTRRGPEYDETTRVADLIPRDDDRIVDFSEIPGLEPERDNGSDESDR